MISLELKETKPVLATELDRRAIQNLISYLKWEIERDQLRGIKIESLNSENNYRILVVDGYENIIFYDLNSGKFLETVQPIDRKADKLFPVQTIELRVCYKQF